MDAKLDRGDLLNPSLGQRVPPRAMRELKNKDVEQYLKDARLA